MALVIDTATLRQEIEGWGAAAVFADGTWMDLPTLSEIQLCYSVTAGIGLTHLRHRIPPVTGTVESLSAAQMVQAMGGEVYGQVFGPPASMKSNGSTIGGTLLAGSRADFGNHICDWIDAMKGYGVNPVAVSLQNEPNVSVGYESAQYTPTQMADMAAVVGPIMATRAAEVLMMLPNTSGLAGLHEWIPDGESEPYGQPYADVAYVEPGLWSILGRLCTNGYGGYNVPIPSEWDRAIWEVEFSRFGNNADFSMADALLTVANLHDAITGSEGVWAGCSLWSYWELLSSLSNNCGIWQYTVRGNPPGKRFWAMGNYSRWVRPGFTRVASSGAPAGVQATAYTGTGGQIVIVAVNQNATPTTLDASGLGAVSSLRCWLTDETHNLTRETDVTVSGGTLSVVLPAYSVTTLESTATELSEIAWSPISIPGALPVEDAATTGTIDGSSLVLTDGQMGEWAVDAGSGGTFRLDRTEAGAGSIAVAVDGVPV